MGTQCISVEYTVHLKAAPHIRFDCGIPAYCACIRASCSLMAGSSDCVRWHDDLSAMCIRRFARVRHLRHSKSDASIRNRWYCCIPDPVRMHHTSHRYGKPADAISVRQYRRLLVGALLPITRVLACRIQWTQSEYQSRQRLHERSFYTIAVDLCCNQVLSRHADCTVGVKLSLSGDRPLLGYLV